MTDIEQTPASTAIVPAAPRRSRPPKLGDTPLDRMVDLLNKGVTPEHLEKLLDIQERWNRTEARKAYFVAMAAFRAEPLGAIVKRKNVRQVLKDKQTGQPTGAEINYKHETLDQVVDVVREPLAKHGLSFAWSVRQSAAPQVITVACAMTHVDGHAESVELFGSPDDSGRKTPIQQVRSTVTFLQRATLLLLCGLAARGEDDDGGKPSAERPEPRAISDVHKATAKQVKLLETRLDTAGIPLDAFLAWANLSALTDVTFDGVNASLEWIKANAKAPA